ncbi:MAG: Crp/Fnr family transcriptional regulator [Candidatus Promineifilaceae bacterium]|jgi:CRP-like cAMP-binding protein
MIVSADPLLPDDAALLTFLRSVPVLAGLTPETLARLAGTTQQISIDKGAYLFLQGDPAHAAYIVYRGWIAIVLHGADGRELVLADMRRYDLFGENAIVTGLPRSASAVAHESSRLLRIAAPDFMATLDNEPLLARHLLQLAARRLSEGNERERALAFLQAGARIARVLLTLDEMDQRTADKGFVTISQDELAQRTGLTRQTVARFLGDWRRQNYLLTGRGRIMLLQRGPLRALEEENLD